MWDPSSGGPPPPTPTLPLGPALLLPLPPNALDLRYHALCPAQEGPRTKPLPSRMTMSRFSFQVTLCCNMNSHPSPSDPLHCRHASTDIVKFTELSSKVPPAQVFAFLNELFGRFDAVVAMFNVYKVETIGDCELGGRSDQTAHICRSADP